MNQLKTYTDKRGSLTIVEEGHEIPFDIQRVYWIHGVPQGEERGKHSNTEMSIAEKKRHRLRSQAVAPRE